MPEKKTTRRKVNTQYSAQKLVQMTPDFRERINDRCKDDDVSGNEFMRGALQLYMDCGDKLRMHISTDLPELEGKSLVDVVTEAFDIYMDELLAEHKKSDNPKILLRRIHALSDPEKVK